MITVEEHLERILDQVEPGEEVALPLDEAGGLVLAQDVTCGVDLPRFDNSAMDGYAVVAAELEGVDPEHPKLLPVQGDIAAGAGEPHTHTPGSVWRIMTGAPVPEGADSIVPLEDTDERPHEVLIKVAPREGAHVRRAGEDARVGDLLVRAGTTIGPAEVAVIASAGISTVRVLAPVRVVVLSTGDELVPLGSTPGPGQIQDSNGPMLVSAVRRAGYYASHLGHLVDDEKSIKAEITHHLDHADVIITTGGVSKGAYDAVKAVLTGEGSMEFSEVAMQPGKPQGFGLLGKRKVPVFTLPGNPVSALISFEVFIRPALAKISGRLDQPVVLPALVVEGWRTPEGRRQYARVRLSRDLTGEYACEPAGGPGSHLVAGLAAADGLAIIDADAEEVQAGEEVQVHLLRPLPEIEARLAAQEESDAEDEDQG